MKSPRLVLSALVLILSAAHPLPFLARADEAPGTFSGQPLIDFATPDASKQITVAKGVPAGSSVNVDKSGVVVDFTAFQPGDADHPGFHLTPAVGKYWDLSACGHVEARITNTGDRGFNLVMHLVDEGESFWSERKLEFVTVQPGETKTVTVIFGYQKGFKPGPPVNAAKMTEIFFCLYHSSMPHSFRIEAVKAAGVPGETPAGGVDSPEGKK